MNTPIRDKLFQDVPTCVVPRTLSSYGDRTFAAAGPPPVELSSSSTTLSGHHLRTVQTTAEGTPFSGSMNTMALCDFDMRRLRRTLTYLCYRIVVCPVCNVGVGLLSVTKRLDGSRQMPWGPALPQKGHTPNFRSMSGWPRAWMDQDATWQGGTPQPTRHYVSRPLPRPHCVRWGPSSPGKGAQQPPCFLAHVYCGRSRPSQLLLNSCSNF